MRGNRCEGGRGGGREQQYTTFKFTPKGLVFFVSLRCTITSIHDFTPFTTKKVKPSH